MTVRWALGTCIALSVYALEDPCARFGLIPAPGDGGYGWREHRCEGLFARSVAGELDIRLVSFAGGLARIDPASTQTLKLNWAAPQGLPVELRAVSLRGRHYYRMDAAVPAQQSSFTWPTDVLRRERLTGAEVGIVAIVPDPIFKDTYVPLTIQGAGDAPELRVIPGAELTDVTYSFDLLAASGALRGSAVAAKELGLGFYPAGRSFRIPVPAALKAGFYLLRLDASVKQGGTVAKKYVIYLPKSP